MRRIAILAFLLVLVLATPSNLYAQAVLQDPSVESVASYASSPSQFEAASQAAKNAVQQKNDCLLVAGAVSQAVPVLSDFAFKAYTKWTPWNSWIIDVQVTNNIALIADTSRLPQYYMSVYSTIDLSSGRIVFYSNDLQAAVTLDPFGGPVKPWASDPSKTISYDSQVRQMIATLDEAMATEASYTQGDRASVGTLRSILQKFLYRFGNFSSSRKYGSKTIQVSRIDGVVVTTNLSTDYRIDLKTGKVYRLYRGKLIEITSKAAKRSAITFVFNELLKFVRYESNPIKLSSLNALRSQLQSLRNSIR